MKSLIGLLLILHGFVVASQSAGSFGSMLPSEVQNPAFVNWWPVNLGRSWLLSWLGWDKTLVFYRVGGVFWLAGGIILVLAGMSLWGFIIPIGLWRSLAVVGAAISLFMLAVYFHPLTIIGTASSLAVLVAILWAKWSPINLVK
jgi:hypothetical protein